ncbi:hypothetical protein SB775_33345, partial [Peribacillus sp. SIMBA_075]|uniref:PAS domain-containing protein n=1 Tax=Peribacillus sp. SIMBA_075 TaxID=3085813 RepID=UPI00397B122A
HLLVALLLPHPLASLAAGTAAVLAAITYYGRHRRRRPQRPLDQAAVQALALVDEAVLVLDAEDRVLDANPAFLRMGGWT